MRRKEFAHRGPTPSENLVYSVGSFGRLNKRNPLDASGVARLVGRYEMKVYNARGEQIAYHGEPTPLAFRKSEEQQGISAESAIVLAREYKDKGLDVYLKVVSKAQPLDSDRKHPARDKRVLEAVE